MNIQVSYQLISLIPLQNIVVKKQKKLLDLVQTLAIFIINKTKSYYYKMLLNILTFFIIIISIFILIIYKFLKITNNNKIIGIIGKLLLVIGSIFMTYQLFFSKKINIPSQPSHTKSDKQKKVPKNNIKPTKTMLVWPKFPLKFSNILVGVGQTPEII